MKKAVTTGSKDRRGKKHMQGYKKETEQGVRKRKVGNPEKKKIKKRGNEGSREWRRKNTRH